MQLEQLLKSSVERAPSSADVWKLAEMTPLERAFQTRAAATGKAQSPAVDSRNDDDDVDDLWCVIGRRRTRKIQRRANWRCMNRRFCGRDSRHRSQRASKSRPICRYWSPCCDVLILGKAKYNPQNHTSPTWHTCNSTVELYFSLCNKFWQYFVSMSSTNTRLHATHICTI